MPLVCFMLLGNDSRHSNSVGFSPHVHGRVANGIAVHTSRFESFMATVNAKSPSVQGFQTTYSGELGVASKWVWMRTQLVFVQSAATGMIVHDKR